MATPVEADRAALLRRLPLLAGIDAAEPWAIGVAILAIAVLVRDGAIAHLHRRPRGGRKSALYSHAQARRTALAYAAVVLASLRLILPYWRAVGVL